MNSKIISGVIAVGLLIGCVLFVPVIWQKGLANAHYVKSQYYLSKWIKDESSLTQFSFDDAHNAAQYAAKKDSENAHYLLNLAKIKEWGWSAHLHTLQENELDKLYLKAIKLRPLWANAYGDYAYSLAFVKRDVAAAFAYLYEGESITPFEETVLQNTILIGEDYWQQLNNKDKVFVLSSALKMLETNNQVAFNYVHQIISVSDYKADFCVYLESHKLSMTEKAINRFEQNICRL